MADQLPSPKFRFFSSKIIPFDSSGITSPTSILEANLSINPTPQRFLHPPDAFGLADLIKNSDPSTKPVNKMVLFGSKLRVHIPCADFGTKSTSAGIRHHPSPRQLSPCLQTKVSEIDQTEDYTRVISHGPNPTITHIFDNSVFVEQTPSSIPPLETKKTDTSFFLRYCYTCNKNLDQKRDIYIYRGDKGFCSSECRYQEMLLDHMDT